MSRGRQLRLAVEGRIITLDTVLDGDQLRVSADGAGAIVSEVRAMAATRGYLLVDGHVVPYYFSRQGTQVQLWVQGRTYRMEVQPDEESGAPSSSDGLVKAPMPGTVFQVLMTPGDVVKHLQPVVIMESMKMELTVVATMGGRVLEVCCAPGQMVDTGVVLVKLEAAHGDG